MRSGECVQEASGGFPDFIGGKNEESPDFIGGKNEESRRQCVKTSKLVLQELMKVRGDDNFIAGERRSLADFHLAPICFYVALTPDADEVFGVKGFTPWWERMQALPSYESTAPQLG